MIKEWVKNSLRTQLTHDHSVLELGRLDDFLAPMNQATDNLCSYFEGHTLTRFQKTVEEIRDAAKLDGSRKKPEWPGLDLDSYIAQLGEACSQASGDNFPANYE